MRKRNSQFAIIAVFVLALLMVSPWAFADNSTSFNDQIRIVQKDRSLMEVKIGIKPHERNYDVADHYNQDHLMRAVDVDVDVWP